MQAAWERGYRRSGRKYGGAPLIFRHFSREQGFLRLGAGTESRFWPCRAGDGISLPPIFPGKQSGSVRVIRFCSNVGFIQADARALPFRRESFDAVFLYHLLGHIPVKGRSLVASETERILVPGGAVFLRVFSVRDFRKGSGDLVEPNTYLRGDGVLTHYFLREEVESLFPGLILTAIRDADWSMKVRGVQLIRSEIVAHFRK